MCFPVMEFYSGIQRSEPRTNTMMWMYLKTIMLVKETRFFLKIHIVLLYVKLKIKQKLLYNRVWLGGARLWKWDCKTVKKTFLRGRKWDRYVYSLDCGYSFIFQIIKLYTIKMNIVYKIYLKVVKQTRTHLKLFGSCY